LWEIVNDVNTRTSAWREKTFPGAISLIFEIKEHNGIERAIGWCKAPNALDIFCWLASL
jgi:hypothetical protein